MRSLIVLTAMITSTAFAAEAPVEADIYMRGVMDECNGQVSSVGERGRILSAERAVLMSRIATLEAKLKAATEKPKEDGAKKE